jgi:hypothetical protein
MLVMIFRNILPGTQAEATSYFMHISSKRKEQTPEKMIHPY